MARGKYIVIEGHDGTGKSTQVTLLREYLAKQGIDSIEIQEPAGMPIADAIRTIIKDASLERDGITNLLLFTAARHELWKQAEAALTEGKWVIASRNYFSTLAYQGYGEGLSLQAIRDTTKTFTNSAYMQPDISVILSLDNTDERKKRLQARDNNSQKDTFESRENNFQDRVHVGYLTIAKDCNIPIIDASQTIEQIHKTVISHLSL